MSINFTFITKRIKHDLRDQDNLLIIIKYMKINVSGSNLAYEVSTGVRFLLVSIALPTVSGNVRTAVVLSGGKYGAKLRVE